MVISLKMIKTPSILLETMNLYSSSLMLELASETIRYASDMLELECTSLQSQVQLMSNKENLVMKIADGKWNMYWCID